MKVVFALIVMLAAGPVAAAKPKPVVAASPDWRGVATRDDLRRLRTWREAFVEGLAQARSSGHGAAVDAEGELLNPDAAIDGGAMPPGDYRCRTIKLGNAAGVGLGFISYPFFACRVTADGPAIRFEKLGGSQRPVGRLFAGGLRRQVFVGTLVLGDEIRPLGYGRDPQRDMIGAIERIGPQKWRLVLPYPRFESTLDIIEILPAN